MWLFVSGALLARALPAQDWAAPPSQLLPVRSVDALAGEPVSPAAQPARRTALETQTGPSGALSVELLTAAAFPSRQPRGIPGGSLLSSHHGLQWPYLPARPGQSRTRLALSGLTWVDSSYRTLIDGSQAEPALAQWEQQARFVLRATPTYEALGGWFAQGVSELVLLGATPAAAEDNLGADDLYLRVGKWHVFDLSAGRFQGWEIYHLGMGLEQNTMERRGASTAQRPALDIGSELQFLWERRAGLGNLALHLYPLEFLRFELLGSFGGGSSLSSSARNALGVRPAAILDFGIIKAKVAADYVRETPRQQQLELAARTLRRGVVGSLQAVVEPLLEAGVAGGYALVDDYGARGVLNAAGSNTTYSFGGFANVRVADGVVLGAGGAYTHQRNLELDTTGTLNDSQTHSQLFGAAQYTLWGQLHIKAVFAYASARFAPESDPLSATFRSQALSARIRLAHAF